MAHAPEKKMELRAAYIGGLPLEAAALKTGVPYATARNWFNAARTKGDDWDKFRAASLLVSGGGIEQAIGRVVAAGLMRCEALLDANKDNAAPDLTVQMLATLGDSIAKLRAASKGMMPEADQLAIENTAVKGVADLFIKMHPALAEKMLATVEAWARGDR